MGGGASGEGGGLIGAHSKSSVSPGSRRFFCFVIVCVWHSTEKRID